MKIRFVAFLLENDDRRLVQRHTIETVPVSDVHKIDIDHNDRAEVMLLNGRTFKVKPGSQIEFI